MIRTIVAVLSLALVPWMPADVIESTDKVLQEAGLSDLKLGFRPQFFRLGQAESESGTGVLVRRGVLEMGAQQSPERHAVAIRWQGRVPESLEVDGNGDGTIGSGETVRFIRLNPEEVRPGGDDVWEAALPLRLPLEGGRHRGVVKFYWSKRASVVQPDWLHYYCDYGMSGRLAFPGGKEVRMVLVDMSCRGTFEFGDVSTTDTAALWLDFDGDGTNDRGEYHLVNRPFEAFGRWYRVAEVASAGLVRLMEVPAPPGTRREGPDLSAGKEAPPFAVLDREGRAVRMPDGYRGKLVLLDFWASWCGPCLTEIPSIVGAGRRFRSDGLEILGVSLDTTDSGAAIAALSAKEGMNWPQVHDGKGWQSDLARLYGIQSIPFRVLVDGTTGKIVVSGDLRREELLSAIEKAVRERKAP